MPNPFKNWRLVSRKDISMIVIFVGIFDMNLTMVLVSLPTLFAERYGLNQISLELCYIMPNTRVIAGRKFNGTSSPDPQNPILSSNVYYLARTRDWSYRIVVKNIKFRVDEVRGDDLDKLPIEGTRVRLAEIFVDAQMLLVFGNGWALHCKAVQFPLPLQNDSLTFQSTSPPPSPSNSSSAS